MKDSKFRIGALAVVMLVALRLTIGWHFFYEGVWKIAHRDEFSTTPFLVEAKGPAAGLYYAMVYDLDGRERLAVEPCASGRPLTATWQQVCSDCRSRYQDVLEKRVSASLKLQQGKPLGLKERQEIDAAVDEFLVPIEVALWEAQDQLAAYLAENQAEMLALAEKAKREPPKELPKEVQPWLAKLAAIEKQYLDAVRGAAGSDASKQEVVARSAKGLVVEAAPGAAAEKILRGDGLASPKGSLLLSFGPALQGTVYLDAWKAQKDAAARKHGLSDGQSHAAERVFRRYADSLAEYLADNQEAIVAYLGSLDRFEAAKAAGGDAADYHKKRVWDQQQKLRAEVSGWLGELDATGREYRAALWNLLDEDQKQRGAIPVAYTREDLMNVLMTFGLTAIGFCLLAGFCTRLACLAGGVFLVNVLLTQPPWPTIYPPAPAVTGHSLVVDKNFVEMVAVFALACVPAGRWGGLDFFVYRWFGRPILRWLGRPVG